MIDLAAPVDDGSVGAHALAGAHQDRFADLELGGLDGLLVLTVRGGVQAYGAFGGQVQQGADRVGRALGDHGLQRAGGGEDDDEQCAVEDLADGGRGDGGHDHQQVHVQGAFLEGAQTGQGRVPPAGDVAGHVQAPPHPGGGAQELGCPSDEEQGQCSGGPAHLG